MSALVRAADCVMAEYGRYAARGVGLAEVAMAGASELRPWRHHPRADALDPRSGARFYYHAHRSSRVPPDEHGHFHLFMPHPMGDGFVHLAALSLDAKGWPLRWFATNRWVTGERWCDAAGTQALLAGFQPRVSGRLAPLARWLAAMTVLFEPMLVTLVRRRDVAIRRASSGRALETCLDDRAIDVLAEVPVSLADRLAQIGCT